MKTKFGILLLVFILVITVAITYITNPLKVFAYSNPATVPLGTVSNFAALAKSTITSPTGPTVLNDGHMGLASPATCTGFPGPDCTDSGNGTINNGSIQYQNTAATTGQTDATAAVSNITGRGTADQTIAGGLLGGQILTQGVYDVPATTTNLTGDLTLNGDADSVFIFRMESTLKTANGSRVILGTGVQACNVFWKVASSATFDGNTTMVGTVLAQASVTFSGSGGTIDGRVIAQTAAITFNNTTVNNSSCAPTPTPTPTSTPTPTTTPTPTSTPTPTPTSTLGLSTSSSGGSSGVFSPLCPPLASTIVAPFIIESKRVSPTDIFFSWGPNSGTNLFNVEYGFEHGKWLYNVDVSGFSTTINNLPANVPIWAQIAGRSDCRIGDYGVSKLIGGPALSEAGIGPDDNNIPWNIAIPLGSLVGIIFFLGLIQRRYRFLLKD